MSHKQYLKSAPVLFSVKDIQAAIIGAVRNETRGPRAKTIVLCARSHVGEEAA